MPGPRMDRAPMRGVRLWLITGLGMQPARTDHAGGLAAQDEFTRLCRADPSGCWRALYMLSVQGRVAVLKANPVNGYLVPCWERAVTALIERGCCGS